MRRIFAEWESQNAAKTERRSTPKPKEEPVRSETRPTSSTNNR